MSRHQSNYDAARCLWIQSVFIGNITENISSFSPHVSWFHNVHIRRFLTQSTDLFVVEPTNIPLLLMLPLFLCWKLNQHLFVLSLSPGLVETVQSNVSYLDCCDWETGRLLLINSISITQSRSFWSCASRSLMNIKTSCCLNVFE